MLKKVEFTYHYQDRYYSSKVSQFETQVRSSDSERIDCKVTKPYRHIHDYMGHLPLNDSFYHRLVKKQMSLYAELINK